MMHESARFALWKNVELYSYLVVTLLPVSSVRRRCRHVPSAGNLSLALLGLFCHKSESSSAILNSMYSLHYPRNVGAVGDLQCCHHDLALIFEQQWYLMFTPPHCFQHFRHPHLLHILIKRAQNLCLYEGLKGFFCILYHGRCHRVL